MIYRGRPEMSQTLMWVGLVLIVVLLLIAAFEKGDGHRMG